MSKSHIFDDTNMQKYYIVTSPTPLSRLNLDDLDGEPDRQTRKKARRLLERRSARLRNQLDF